MALPNSPRKDNQAGRSASTHLCGHLSRRSRIPQRLHPDPSISYDKPGLMPVTLDRDKPFLEIYGKGWRETLDSPVSDEWIGQLCLAAPSLKKLSGLHAPNRCPSWS